MPAEPFEFATTRMMSTVALPGPLTASMPLPALRLAVLSARVALIAPEPPLPSTRSPSPLLLSMRSRRSAMFAAMPPVGWINKPVALLRIVVSATTTCAVVALPAPGDSVMPDVVKPSNTHWLIFKRAPLVNTTPEVPDALTPSKMRPPKLITSLEPALMTMPLVPGEGVVPATAAPPTAFPKMVSDLAMVTGPKSPGSSTSISPPAVVCASAAAKVRQGAERVHGLESLPNVAETKVCDEGPPPPDDENIAVTLSSEFMVTRQVPLPVQAPPQPLKVAPPVGVAVSITDVPLE